MFRRRTPYARRRSLINRYFPRRMIGSAMLAGGVLYEFLSACRGFCRRASAWPRRPRSPRPARNSHFGMDWCLPQRSSAEDHCDRDRRVASLFRFGRSRCPAGEEARLRGAISHPWCGTGCGIGGAPASSISCLLVFASSVNALLPKHRISARYFRGAIHPSSRPPPPLYPFTPRVGVTTEWAVFQLD